jgi:hypothetical protein
MFTLSALCFGDYEELGIRLFRSWGDYADFGLVSDIRIGLNAVPEAIQQVYFRYLKTIIPQTLPVTFYSEKDNNNVGKYPLMRRMFYDPEAPISETNLIMWFDDDSFLTGPCIFPEIKKKFSLETSSVLLGSPYRISPRGKQLENIAKQPWYRLKFEVYHKFLFVTGGWWVARYSFLKEWDYPFPQIHHNGGDTVLGELVRQQGKKIIPHRYGVAINADSFGRESKAVRRGMQTRLAFEETDIVNPKIHDFVVIKKYLGDVYEV